MIDSLYTACASLTARAKVSIALAIAQKVVPCLRADNEAFCIAERAILDCWQWQAGVGMTAQLLYDSYHDSLMNDEMRLGLISARMKFGNVTAQAALLYTVAEATEQDRKSGVSVEFPEDVYEVTDTMLDFIHDRARKTQCLDEAWLERAVKFLQEWYSGEGIIGEPVDRDAVLSA